MCLFEVEKLLKVQESLFNLYPARVLGKQGSTDNLKLLASSLRIGIIGRVISLDRAVFCGYGKPLPQGA